MRNEKEMLAMILNYAENHDDIRAVILNGSRTNPEVTPDALQDYDVVFLVENLAPYKDASHWPQKDLKNGAPAVDPGEGTDDIYRQFGELLVMQRTDFSELYHENFDEYVCYLMQFKDGNRIDLTIADKLRYHGYCFDDRLSVVLLDKDGFLPPLPPPNASSHDIVKPSRNVFCEAVNGFWWMTTYVSKGLWRRQALYAHHHLTESVIETLSLMLSWYAGAMVRFPLSVGKQYDGLQHYLPETLWERYLALFTGCETGALWQALFGACELFQEVAEVTARKFGYDYDRKMAEDVLAFLKYTRRQPYGSMEFTPLEDGIYPSEQSRGGK